jgi:hypothetical protein
MAQIFDVGFTPNIRHLFDNSARQLGANKDILHRRRIFRRRTAMK